MLEEKNSLHKLDTVIKIVYVKIVQHLLTFRIKKNAQGAIFPFLITILMSLYDVINTIKQPHCGHFKYFIRVFVTKI